MYKKINSYIAIIGLCGFIQTLLPMQEEQALKTSLLKHIIPALAINDYILPTKNGYQGFKKEISLVDTIVKRARFTQINNYIALKQKGPLAGRFPAEDDYLEKTRNIYYPHFNYIEIEYRKSHQNPHSVDAHIIVDSYTYYFTPSRFKSLLTLSEKYIVKDIDTSPQHNNVITCPLRWLAALIPTITKKNYNKSYFIELCSDKRVSDWVKVVGGNQLFNKSIPLLSLNNFIIPVKTAYQALQKDAELIYASLEKSKKSAQSVVRTANNRIKEYYQTHGTHVHTIPIAKTSKDIIHPAGCSVAQRIEIIYKKSPRYNDILDVDVIASTFIYRVCPSGEFKSKKHTEHVYHLPNVKTKNIMHYLPPQSFTCNIMASEEHHIVDRILIKNLCNPTKEEKSPKEHIIHTHICDRLIFLVGAMLVIYSLF